MIGEIYEREIVGCDDDVEGDDMNVDENRK